MKEHDGKTDASDGIDLVEALRQLNLIRSFERAAMSELKAGNIPGALHVAVGQEAVAVGACWPLGDGDAILSTHRGHHHCLAMGARADRMMAELFGRRDGYGEGRAGSMHFVIPELGILGTNGIVGAGLPIAVGSAYAMQLAGKRCVTVCFFGEGAVTTGAFGEAINCAALWNLPLVMVCENNQFVELLPNDRHLAGTILARGEAHGMPAERVDGNDVVAMAEVAASAVGRARAGGGPTLIEAETYRWDGHYVGDRASLRSEGELDWWMENRDPVRLAASLVSDQEAEAAAAWAEAEVMQARDFAHRSEKAVADDMHKHHYAARA